MCETCWIREYASAQTDTPAVRHAAALVARVYQYNPVGGGLHVELDDWNLDDTFSRFTDFDTERESEAIAVEEECAAAFNALSIPERASALALHQGYWAPELPPEEAA